MKALTIPNKLYFRIGEVADLLSVKPYVLRYWETEFPDVKPAKSKSGQRLYKRRDVELLVHIKGLLYHENFTINGARKRLKEILREHRHEEVPQMALGLSRDTATPPAESNLASYATAPAASRTTTPRTLVRPTVAAPQPSGDSRKIFAKIRRDLESILDFLKS